MMAKGLGIFMIKTGANNQIFLLKRCLTYGQATNALRPFFFAVHPDFFSNTPLVSTVNENSLKTLNGYLQSISIGDICKPMMVTFYLRSSQQGQHFKPVTFHLNRRDLYSTVLDVLSSCNLPTDHIKSLPKQSPRTVKHTPSDPISDKEAWDCFIQHRNPRQHPVTPSKNKKLVSWFLTNVKPAQELVRKNIPLIQETNNLINKLKQDLQLTDIIWQSDWAYSSFRCNLAAFDRLINESSSTKILKSLQNQRLIFTRRSGISVLGDVLLSTADVPQSWLQTLIKVESCKKILDSGIPSLEQSISILLNGAKVTRLTQSDSLFMVEEYERHLKRLLSTLLGNPPFSKSQLEKADLSSLEIALDDAIDRPRLSREGVILLPVTNPAFILLDFINDCVKQNSYLQKRADHIVHMSRWDKVRSDCIVGLEASSIYLDSNVSIDEGIACCQGILEDTAGSGFGTVNLHKCDIRISNFYSVTPDGILSIPWNWNSIR